MTQPEELPELDRRMAVLSPHLYDGASLTAVSGQAGVSLRTAQRWLASYLAEGAAGLMRSPRADRGGRRVPDELVEVIEGLALRRPPPKIAQIHRQISELAGKRGAAAPSYDSVRRIVGALEHLQIYLRQAEEILISEHAAPGTLTIGELAERTGVPTATLRSWEARYGAPLPRRLAGGHRRYAEDDVAVVEEILRHRAAGLSLDSAVNRAGVHVGKPEPSVFAALRRRHPELQPRLLRKSTVLALTLSIEDECCARAESPVLFAGFQSQDFYRQSRLRWSELARTAQSAVVFADFAEPSQVAHQPVEIPLPTEAPMLREWVVVCDAPDYPACLAAWEHPGQNLAVDAQRRFEAVWSVDPGIVRHAARVCAGLTRASAPQLADTLAEWLAGSTPSVSADLRRASSLFDRMLGYLDGARKP